MVILIYNLIFELGDNLLTALCVAKKCNMVEKHHKVVLVEAHLSNEDGDQNATNSVPPRIEWKLVENYDDQSLDENTEFSYQSQSYAVSFYFLLLKKNRNR